MSADAAPVQYEPRDVLYLWWLGRPQAPVLIGDLQFVRMQRSVSLRYDAHWLAQGFALSEDLPLLDQEFIAEDKDVVVGAVDDARPDRWGERVIRFIDRPARLSLMEFLFLAGDDRFGALGVSVSRSAYEPRRLGPLPQMNEVEDVQAVVQKVMAGESVAEDLKRLITPGVTMGGARPKALVNLDGQQWVVKFSEPGEALDVPLIEHAAMSLSSLAGIRAAQTMPVPLKRGHAVAVRRFDRDGGMRLHALSAHVALRAAGEEMGYPELAQLLRRRGPVRSGAGKAHMRELFRRMVFNILIDNTDDHEKNHALLMTDSGEYELSPAFDVLPTGQALGYQQMRVGSDGATSSIENALSELNQFGLSKQEAQEDVRMIARAVDGWRDHFAACGVTAADIESLAQQIDRAELKSQRQVWC
jgi:serine/threonine-protein kinase HipA